jgi:oligopeptide transport system substrate-binding protein
VRLLLPVALLVAALLAALSLDRPLPRADLIVIERADCYTLDPQRMSYQHELRRARVIYETLVNLRASDCEIVPGVAERWELGDDGRTWTFTLRADAKWSNGDPVTARDVAYAWRRAILPDTAADYSGLFAAIEGVEAFASWRAASLERYAAEGSGSPARADLLWRETLAKFDELVAIKTPDDRTLVVRLRQPLPYFLDFCAFPPFAPVHERTVESFVSLDPDSGRVVQRHGWTKPGAIVVNGAYLPTVWRYKRDMRLEKNPHYWNRGEVVSESIEFRTIDNPSTGVLSFETGAADWLPDLGAEYRIEMLAERRAYLERHREAFDAARARGLSVDEAVASLPEPGPGERRDLRGIPAFGTDFFSFNCRPKLVDGRPNPFHDARVRRAFALAVNKQQLIDRVTRLGERVTGTLVPVGSIPGYPEVTGLGFDPERARAELRAAGYEDRDGDGVVESADGTRFPTVDILYSAGNPRYRDLSLAMRDMWKRELRVDAECRSKDSKLYKADLQKGNFMVARGGWYGDYGDPTTWLDLQKSGDGNNDRGYSDPAFDAMLRDAHAIADPAARLRALAECERFLFNDAVPLMPLCNYVTVYMYDPTRLTGLTDHPRLEQDLSEFGPPRAERAP